MVTKLVFTCNSLSKKDFFKSLLYACYTSKTKTSKIKSLLSGYFGIPQNRFFLFGAARMGIFTYLKGLGLNNEDEVLVPGYTCVVLTNAIKFAGPKVRYVDIKENDVNPSVDQYLKKITTKTKAIVVPHNFGIPFKGISEIRAKHPSLKIIEDVAHSFSSEVEGRKCGLIGDAAIFSFEYSKPITCGMGGLLIVNDHSLSNIESFYSKLKNTSNTQAFRLFITLKGHCLARLKFTDALFVNTFRVLSKLGLIYQTSQREINGELPKSYPVKLHSWQKGFLLVQLGNINTINQKKTAIIERYETALASVKAISTLELNNVNMVRYPILFDSSVQLHQIEELKKMGASKGYNFGVWFNDVVHPKGSYRYCYQEGDCANGEKLANRMINLPVNIYRRLSDNDLKEIVNLMNAVGIK